MVIQAAKHRHANNQHCKYNAFAKLAGGYSKRFDGWKTKFKRNRQQPRHAFFGKTIHHQMRYHTDHKCPPHEADINLPILQGYLSEHNELFAGPPEAPL